MQAPAARPGLPGAPEKLTTSPLLSERKLHVGRSVVLTPQARPGTGSCREFIGGHHADTPFQPVCDAMHGYPGAVPVGGVSLNGMGGVASGCPIYPLAI